MTDTTDLFYLDKMYPDSMSIFSSTYKTTKEIIPEAIIVLDTNILLAAFDANDNTKDDIKRILAEIKNSNRLIIPARVAREFANNRGKKIGELFLKMRQLKENLNRFNVKIDDYPLLDGNNNYLNLKKDIEAIASLISDARKKFTAVESDIKQWHWNDEITSIYKDIFTSEVIVEVKKDSKDIETDLKFRMQHQIAPGYNDSKKLDEGIGDLIIWQTIMEVGLDKQQDVIFVSNDQKNDWYYKQDKIGLYPRFELFDEFRRFTNGQSINIIDFASFLKLMNASADSVKEMEAQTISNYLEQPILPFKKGFRSDEIGIGMIVEHFNYGKGIVSEILRRDGYNDLININFSNGRAQRMILFDAPLRIIYWPSNNSSLSVDVIDELEIQ